MLKEMPNAERENERFEVVHQTMEKKIITQIHIDLKYIALQC